MIYAILKLRAIKIYDFLDLDPYYILDDVISISSENEYYICYDYIPLD
jgi:hypothetical protein